MDDQTPLFRVPGEGGRSPERQAQLRQLATLDRELAAVDAALEAIDAGSYGRCEVCREPIADERLAADPVTVRCAAHEGAGS
jgi:DnaK suppressor protein